MAPITKKFEMTLDESIQKFPCKKCCLESNHKVVANYTERGSEDYGGGHTFDWTAFNQIIQCLGVKKSLSELSHQTLKIGIMITKVISIGFRRLPIIQVE